MVPTPRFRSDRNVGATNWFCMHVASDISSMSVSVYLALGAVNTISDMAGSNILHTGAYSVVDHRAYAAIRFYS